MANFPTAVGTTNFTIEGRAGAVIKDIQRDWAWLLTIPLANTAMVTNAGLELQGGIDNEVTIRARSVSMPSRGVETIPSEWMGQKQFFPGKMTLGNTVAIQFEESENQNVAKMLYAWQNYIMDITKGHSNALGKRATANTSYVTDMHISLLSYAGTPSDTVVYFKNVFPTNVADVPLSYGGTASVKFDVTFQFDFWYLMKIGDSITKDDATAFL